jgi:L,D-peptidoglycan transpeptidase YkuD (ErfK/YbiS/YcfS/YnhG family)
MLFAVVLLAASPIPPESRQLLLSLSESWGATAAHVRRYERSSVGEPWRRVGAGVTASLGRRGLGWGRGLHPAAEFLGPPKREGDGKSPAGVFDLRLATGYATDPPPGTKLHYRRATPTLRCVDDPGSAFYNQLVDEAQVKKDWTSAEDMRRPDDLYRLVVWVGHNDAPVLVPAGSCIFLHLRASATATTEGCTAFDAGPLLALLRWLDPAQRPVLVQLPRQSFRALADPWGLPRSGPGPD